MDVFSHYLLLVYIPYQVTSSQILWDNTAETNFNDINVDVHGRLNPIIAPNWFLIFPGTKWCGAGNIAENDDDLGDQADTDRCCRSHDFCPDIIEGFETKYNLTNTNFYTRLNCECDNAFYHCLKSVDTKTSNQVGQIYFTVLGTQCYRNEYPINGCKRYTYFPRKKCLEYVFNESKPMEYQWFDVPNF